MSSLRGETERQNQHLHNSENTKQFYLSWMDGQLDILLYGLFLNRWCHPRGVERRN